MSAPTTAPSPPVLGVLDADGLHLSDGSLAPIKGTIRHVGCDRLAQPSWHVAQPL